MGKAIICNRKTGFNASDSIITTTSTCTINEIESVGSVPSYTSKSNLILNDLLLDKMPPYILIIFPNIAISYIWNNGTGMTGKYYKAITMVYHNEALIVHSTPAGEANSTYHDKILHFSTEYMADNFTMSIINNKLVITNYTGNDGKNTWFSPYEMKSNYVIVSYCI